jgi:hypothetical protein
VRHQAAVSPAVVGLPWMRSAGCAPSAASRWRSVSTSARYVAFVVDHGIASCEPWSSLSAIHGVGHADEATAFA